VEISQYKKTKNFTGAAAVAIATAAPAATATSAAAAGPVAVAAVRTPSLAPLVHVRLPCACPTVCGTLPVTEQLAFCYLF
jgi:hypothetical protein